MASESKWLSAKLEAWAEDDHKEKKMITGAGQLVNKSLDAMGYIIKYHHNTPALHPWRFNIGSDAVSSNNKRWQPSQMLDTKNFIIECQVPSCP